MRAVLVCLALAFALTGCQLPGAGALGPGGEQDASTSPKATPTPPAPEPEPPATISVTPKRKTKAVITDPIVVTADGGRLTSVKVTDADGKRIRGDLSKRGTRWSTDEDGVLDSSATYTVRAKANNADGKVTTVKRTVTTGPWTQLVSSLSPLDDDHVGVGQPMVVVFSSDVENKKAVEKRMKITTSRKVTGAWHWFTDREVHYRPKTYWPAGTDVTLTMDLRGVKAGDHLVGVSKRTRTFHVGDAQIQKINLQTHELKYYVNGKLDRTIPITGGKPGWETRSGVKVVLAVEHDIVMKSSTIGVSDKDDENYYEQWVEYAIRVTWSGEFVHSAPWSVGSQGYANVSHGCVGMSTANAKYLYDRTLRGDIVDVTGSGVQMEKYGNGYGDWNYSWEDWKAGSALH